MTSLNKTILTILFLSNFRFKGLHGHAARTKIFQNIPDDLQERLLKAEEQQ